MVLDDFIEKPSIKDANRCFNCGTEVPELLIACWNCGQVLDENIRRLVEDK